MCALAVREATSVIQGVGMTLSNEDKKWLEEHCGSTTRVFLYFMVFMIFINSCGRSRIEYDKTNRAINITRNTDK